MQECNRQENFEFLFKLPRNGPLMENLLFKYPWAVMCNVGGHDHCKEQKGPRLGKSNFFANSEILGMNIGQKKGVNYDKFEIATNCVKQTFNLNAFSFFLFTGATWYYHTICLVITYFASFTDYEDDIFQVISNWHVQRSKFGQKIKNLAANLKKKWTPQSLWSLFFPSLKGPWTPSTELC